MLKNLSFVLILIAAFSCRQIPKESEPTQTAVLQKDFWRHLAYLVRLKNDVAERHWEAFSKKDIFGPAAYYTAEATFILNPNDHIQKITENREIEPFGALGRLRLSEKYIDTTHFNFSTSYSDTDSTALYFRDNVLSFQSFDLTRKLIGVKDLEDWSIMVIHELFHGYQRRIPEFKAYYTQLPIPGGPDAFLGNYHRDLHWFKESVRQENQLLKEVWIGGADLVENLKKYNALRTARIDRIKERFGVDIREVEDYEIAMEGHARYFESLCKRFLSKRTSDTSMLAAEDRPYITGIFEGYEIEKDKALSDIHNDRYYYPLGYNISMILEKYLPEYQETIYSEQYNFNPYLEALLERYSE